MTGLITICADVGSVAKGNFGWWSSRGEDGRKLSTLADHVGDLLNEGVPVALGFECPLFLPLMDEEAALTRARPGEGSRSWSAGAGCGALATGLVQVAWALREIRQQLIRPAEAFLSWDEFSRAGTGLFLWEAFVTGAAKGNGHVEDARLGAAAFMRSLPNPDQFNSISCQAQVYSMVGAALLRTGWSTDLRALHEPCLVIRG